MSATDEDYRDAQERVTQALIDVMGGELRHRLDDTEWMSVLAMIAVQLCKGFAGPEGAGRMFGAAMGTL